MTSFKLFSNEHEEPIEEIDNWIRDLDTLVDSVEERRDSLDEFDDGDHFYRLDLELRHLRKKRSCILRTLK